MAALEVVKRRLDEIGLGVACLELHSHKTNKRSVLQDLEATWKLDKPIAHVDSESTLNDLNETRRLLNEYAVANNEPLGRTGVTPIDARGELAKIRDIELVSGELPYLRISALNSWSIQEFRSAVQTVQDFERRNSLVGVLSSHPFNGCQLTSLTPLEKEDLRGKLTEARGTLRRYRSAAGELCSLLGLPDRHGSKGISHLIGIGERVSVAPDVNGVSIGEFPPEDDESLLEDLASNGAEWRKSHLSHDHLVADGGWDADVGWAIDTLIDFEDSRWLKPSRIGGAIDALEKTCQLFDKLVEDANRLAGHLELSERIGFADVSAMRRLAGHISERPDVDGFNLLPLRSEITRSEIQKLTDTGRARTELQDQFSVALTPAAWDEDVTETRNTIDQLSDRFWRLLSGRYRRSRKKLASLCRGEIPSDKDRQLHLLNAIIEMQRLTTEFRRYSANGSQIFGTHWQSENTDFRVVAPVIDWAMAMYDGIDSGRFNRADVFALRHDADVPTAFQLIEHFDKSLDALTIHVDDVSSSYSIDGVLLLSGLNDSGVFSLASLRQNLLNRIGVAHAVRKALSHLGSISRFGDSDDVKRLISIARKIEEEQKLRDAITSSISAMSSFLGPNARGLESNWEHIEEIRVWCADLFDAVNDGRVEISDVKHIRNDFDAKKVSMATNRLNEASKEHRMCVGNLQKSLEYAPESQMNEKSSHHGIASISTDVQAELLEQWVSNFDELDAFVGYNAAAKEMNEKGLDVIVGLASDRQSIDGVMVNALSSMVPARFV